MSDSIDYETLGEEYWRIDRFAKVAELFDIGENDLADWHEFLAGRGRSWTIIRRRFGVYPLLSGDPDAATRLDVQTLAKELGISQSSVEREIEGAAEAWKLARARGNLREQMDSQKSDIDALTHYTFADGLDEDSATRLLRAFDFDSVRDPAHRLEVAGRILTLKEYLTAPNTRTAAREIIRAEITMHGLQKMQIDKQGRIEDILADPDNASKQIAGTLDKLQDQINALDDRIRKIATDHGKMLEHLGADELDQTSRKKQFVADVNYLIEACRQYESDPENLKLDGVWTAGEIDWLLDPTAEGRDPQYRPDIAIRTAEALRPENLWDENYRPTPIARRITQELDKMVRHLRGIPEDAEPLPDPIDDEDPDSEATPEAFEPETDVKSPEIFASDSPTEAADEPAMGVF